MKKIHGTYSIQSETITNVVISPDAAILESKLALDHSTQSLSDRINGITDSISNHASQTVNPHSDTIQQFNVTNMKTVTAHSDGLKVSGNVKFANDVTFQGTVSVTGNASGNIQAANSAKLTNMVPCDLNNTEANSIVRTDSDGYVRLINAKLDSGSVASPDSVVVVKDGIVYKSNVTSIRDFLFSSKIYTGESTFNGEDGRLVTLPSAATSYAVSITPVITDGIPANVGNVSVLKQNNSFTVYNTGTFRGTFNYIAVVV